MSAIDDAFDGPETEDHDEDNVTCKHCGATGLSWVHTGTRYRLADSKGFHFCKARADDFDVIK